MNTNPNNNQSNNNQISLGKGWYSKPHGLIDLVAQGQLAKTEYILLDFLIAFENRHTRTGGSFWCSDQMICLSGLISSKSLVEARRGLIAKGFIKFKKGHSFHASEYEILIKKEDYFRGGKQ